MRKGTFGDYFRKKSLTFPIIRLMKITTFATLTLDFLPIHSKSNLYEIFFVRCLDIALVNRSRQSRTTCRPSLNNIKLIRQVFITVFVSSWPMKLYYRKVSLMIAKTLHGSAIKMFSICCLVVLCLSSSHYFRYCHLPRFPTVKIESTVLIREWDIVLFWIAMISPLPCRWKGAIMKNNQHLQISRLECTYRSAHRSSQVSPRFLLHVLVG